MTKATHYLHKIKLNGRTSRYSAYYHADHICGLDSWLSYVVDAERIDRLGRSYPCTDKEIEELKLYRHNAKPY